MKQLMISKNDTSNAALDEHLMSKHKVLTASYDNKKGTSKVATLWWMMKVTIPLIGVVLSYLRML